MTTLTERGRNVVNAVLPYIDGHVLPPLAEVYDLAEAIKAVEERQAKCRHRVLDNAFCPDCGKQLRKVKP